jgi:uncharacterized protein DUF5753
LLAEAALRHPVGTPEETIGQVDRLMSVIGLPDVRLGILPSDRRLPFVLTHGFAIFDRLVLVDTMTAELRITDPDQVMTYNRVIDRLWKVAVEGDGARGVLGDVSTALRKPDTG